MVELHVDRADVNRQAECDCQAEKGDGKDGQRLTSRASTLPRTSYAVPAIRYFSRISHGILKVLPFAFVIGMNVYACRRIGSRAVTMEANGTLMNW